MLRMLPTETSLDFAANVSLVSLPPSHRHTLRHASRRPIRRCLAHSAVLLSVDWRTWAAREG